MKSEYVIVKGMKMPNSCTECRFFNDCYDYPYCIACDTSKGYTFPIHKERFPECPLVKIAYELI